MEEDNNVRAKAATKSRTRAAFGGSWRAAKFVAGAPVVSLDVDRIKKGADFIRHCASVVRLGQGPDPLLAIRQDGYIDLPRTAAMRGLTEYQLEILMIEERKHLARIAYVLAILAGLSMFGWVIAALRTEMRLDRVLAAVEYVPFVTAILLCAFRAAYLNWQIRAQRMGSVVEYLTTTEPFLPS